MTDEAFDALRELYKWEGPQGDLRKLREHCEELRNLCKQVLVWYNSDSTNEMFNVASIHGHRRLSRDAPFPEEALKQALK